MLKGRENKTDWQGNLQPEKWQYCIFPGLPFCLFYPKVGAEDADHLEMPIGRKKRKEEKHQKSLPFF